MVRGLAGHGVCLTPQQELAWFVSQAVSSSGTKSNACQVARKLAGRGDKTARKAERFACAAKVVLNTGFGGAAGSCLPPPPSPVSGRATGSIIQDQ